MSERVAWEVEEMYGERFRGMHEAAGEVGEEGTLRDRHSCRRRLWGMVKGLMRKR